MAFSCERGCKISIGLEGVQIRQKTLLFQERLGDKLPIPDDPEFFGERNNRESQIIKLGGRQERLLWSVQAL